MMKFYFYGFIPFDRYQILDLVLILVSYLHLNRATDRRDLPFRQQVSKRPFSGCPAECRGSIGDQMEYSRHDSSIGEVLLLRIVPNKEGGKMISNLKLQEPRNVKLFRIAIHS